MSPLPLPVVLPPGLFAKRQEACALSCLATVPAGSCTAGDASCLCPNNSWGTNILSCVQATCPTQDVLHLAYQQLLSYCLLSDVTFTLPEPSFTRSSVGSATASATITASASASASAIAIPTIVVTSTASGDVVAAPSSGLIYPNPVNVSGIMAGVCSIFFAIALVFGYFGVREKLRQERQQGDSRPRGNWPRGPDSTEKAEAASSNNSENRSAPSANRSQRKGPPEMSQTDTVSTLASTFGPDEVHAGLDLEKAERKEKLRRVRLERAEAAELIRRESLLHIFTPVPSLENASPTSTTSSASIASPLSYRSSLDSGDDSKKFTMAYTAFDEKEEDDEDGYHARSQGHGEDESDAQYVVMPSTRDSTVLDPFTPTSVQSTETQDGLEDGPRAPSRNLWLVDRPMSMINRQQQQQQQQRQPQQQ